VKRIALLFCLLAGGPAMAVTCENLQFQDKRYTACEVDPAVDQLRLFHKADDQVLGSFRAVEGLPDVSALPFAMNAGMYHPDRAPVGLYIEDNVQVMRVIPNAGPGNFGLLPNGVFCITDDSARVIETGRYIAENPQCRDATQSGPMLVIDGALHPRFLPDSTSRYLRNGVGTTAAGDRAVFVISNEPVTFYEFGQFFRDGLGLPQALYFDGNVSRLHAPALNRSDFGRQMGPIVGVVE
jgi:uncharacterized protein YigE (DUF2233 family)